MPTSTYSSETEQLFKNFLRYAQSSTSERRKSTSDHNGPAGIPSVDAAIMEGSKFARLARDAGLTDHGGTADIIFTRIKDRHQRKLSFRQFQRALGLFSDGDGTFRKVLALQF